MLAAPLDKMRVNLSGAQLSVILSCTVEGNQVWPCIPNHCTTTTTHGSGLFNL